MIIEEADYLAHYGILRKSGRYPWGSGEDQETRNRDFLGYVDTMRKQGLSDTEIARGVGLTTPQFRAAKSITTNAERQHNINTAQQLRDKGMSNIAIGEQMGKNESSVRGLLAPGAKDRADILSTTAQMLRDEVAEKRVIDVGTNVENHLGVSADKLRTAVAILKEEGYESFPVQIDQLGTNHKTVIKVLTAPGVTYRDVVSDKSQIKSITSRSDDQGRSYDNNLPPLNINSKRIAIRYAEQGGRDADGVIHVRPGVEDVSLGASRYAQVRIAVDGTHYLKGMAIYKDDLPDGVDLVFNTNKHDTGNKLDSMKAIKDDPENPFGATFRQIKNEDKTKVTSSMNLVNEEGDWDEWSRNLSSQFLSKQSPTLAKTQLDVTFENKKNELEDILKLTNPAVRKKLLEGFSEDVDASAIHLKAAALPRQASKVILPINSLKDTEIYAPTFNNGERVVLVRYPHGGVFEIPELTVNNRNPEAKKAIDRGRDAVGINSRVAARLSGADFDGDTVLVIPNNSNKVKTAPALEDLKKFDPQHSFPPYDGMKTMGGGTWNAATNKEIFPPGKSISSRRTQTEMGKISNLITDMTIQAAPHAELARAVRHSMVVIDAEKHKLDFKESSIKNGIASLEAKYQPKPDGRYGGASTLISRKKQDLRVPERKNRVDIDPATGRKIFTNTGASYTKITVNERTGVVKEEVIQKTTKVKRLSVEDAHDLSSGTPIETVYADHSNRLKTLANTARKEMVATRTVPYSPSAKSTYSNEVATLNAKLNIALKNRPLERQAQILANTSVSAKRAASPDMEAAEIKKLKGQELLKARNRTGAKKHLVEITEREWEAIQAGAISNNKLTDVLNNADLDEIKKLATPKSSIKMTSTKTARAKQMFASGYTQAEIASALGVSLTTLKVGLAE